MNRVLIRSVVVLIALLVVAGPAAAGGWATVRLDAEPGSVVAGEPLTFGFLVKQHDRTPINDVDPVVRAVHMDTGEVVTAEGEQSGAVGHFVATITFPAPGDWKWEIAPEPFAPTTLETLVVLPTLAEAQNEDVGTGLQAEGTLGSVRIAFRLDIGLMGGDSAGAGSGDPVEVAITDGGYSPSHLEIAAGTEVVWTNQSAMAHDVGSDNLGFRDSGLLDAGDEFRQVFSEAGTYHYQCGPHPFMTGTIVVVE